MDFEACIAEIRQRFIEGKATNIDLLAAQRIEELAPEIAQKYDWLRALSGGHEVDAWMIHFIQSEIAIA